MKSIWLLASLSMVTAAVLSGACSSKDDDNDGGGAGSGGSSATGGGSKGTGDTGNNDEGGAPGSSGKGGKGGTGNGNGGADDGNGAGQGNDDAGAGPGGGGAPGGNGEATISSCSTGKLLAGDPLYTGLLEGEKPKGQGLLDSPPIRNEAIAVIGSKVFVETEFDIWSFDMNDADPQLVRFAGAEPSTFIKAGVACKDTRFLVMRDMTATADGKLVVVDYVGGAVIEITDPAGPNCMSHYVAGTHEQTDDPGQDYPLAHGDQDGPGADALFGGDSKGAGIHKVAVDPEGNIYTWDEGTGKVKKIATDDDRTVSTIGKLDTDDNVMSLAFVKGKLYAVGVDGTNDFLLEIDPGAYDKSDPTGNVKEVFRNRGDQFPETEGSGHQASLADLEADGDTLIVSGQIQFVWRIDTDGTVLATLAGSTGDRGPGRIEYEGGFDPTVPHPANEWQLGYKLSNPDGGPWLALSDSKLYWSGGFATGKHILEFTCK
ncbi:MAG TPA: hypothetical protein VEQ59_08015 [Polyangiaceae bacterium]|nr:hypothetical protein [Polyangiaceae bacterium]